MTKLEAIAFFMDMDECTHGGSEPIQMAIKALEEQDSILDKIKAEIEEQVLESLSDGGDDWFAAEKVNECLEIIDKYKAGDDYGSD